MRLLILTQKVDRNDPVLGFFHQWLVEFSKYYNQIFVICLELGDYDLPHNVRVFSLGKERVKRRMLYVINFYKYIWMLRKDFDSVFVHMNQEYVLLGGLIWKIFGKNIFMWRNHPRGSVLTKIAIMFSEKVFYTSTMSYTAKFKKSVKMPAGVDLRVFKPLPNQREKKSVCMLGRISPIKGIHIAIESMSILKDRGVLIDVSIIGPVSEQDKKYFISLNELINMYKLENHIHFHGPVKQTDVPQVLNKFEFFLNLTEDGSFDKTIVEAIACGLIPIVSNKSLTGSLPSDCVVNRDPMDISETLYKMINANDILPLRTELDKFCNNNSLERLAEKIANELEKSITSKY